MSRWLASVRWRLTFWYSFALAAMLAVFALGTLAVLESVLAERGDHFLKDGRDAFLTELRVELREIPSKRDAIVAAMRDVQFASIHFLVYDREGKLVAASDEVTLAHHAPSSIEMPPPLDRAAVAALAAPAHDSLPALTHLDDERGGYRLALLRMPLRGEPHTIVAAQALHGIRDTIERVALAFLVTIPLFLLIAGIGGYLLARRALAPVATMSRRARELGASTLHERLPVKNPHDELGELATMVNELLGRLESAFAQQRRFVADASHELRTPVAIIRAEADVALVRVTRSEQEYRDALQIVRDAGERLSHIVDDLFLLTRADSGHQPLRPEAIYLEELVADVVRGMRLLAARRTIQIELADVAESPYEGDPDLLHRMLLNLIDNAVKHGPLGSVVRVRLTHASGAYRISIADEGLGIPPDAHERVFERFYRVDHTRARAGTVTRSGAGLGLAIARWVAEAHGGRLELARSSASGSEFVVVLPAVPPSDTPSLPDEAPDDSTITSPHAPPSVSPIT
jgi:heavy metal sensor kinase